MNAEAFSRQCAAGAVRFRLSFMLRLPGIRLLVLASTLAGILTPMRAFAQDDPNDMPLGDVARNLRKKSQSARPVIDDDNLSQVMDQAASRKSFGSSLRYLMDGDSKSFQVSAPDVTCSLAFTANVKSLLSSTQYSELNLPQADLAKLEGPATIEGDSLSVSIFNATTWHVSELQVALTVIRKTARDVSPVGSAEENANSSEVGIEVPQNPFQQVRPEKKPDTTTIYRMRSPAAPWQRAVFSAPLNVNLAPGDEWHWGIVQAKGYPPESERPSESGASSVTATGTPAASLLTVPGEAIRPVSAMATPQDAPIAAPQSPQ
jgi:hypothetical protein